MGPGPWKWTQINQGQLGDYLGSISGSESDLGVFGPFEGLILLWEKTKMQISQKALMARFSNFLW